MKMNAKPEPSTAAMIWNALAGIAIGSLVYAFAYPVTMGFALFDLKFLLVYSGCLAALFGFGPLAWFVAHKRQRDLARAGFSIGLGIAAGGLLGAWMFSITDRPRALLEFGAPLTLLFLFAPLPALPPRFARVFGSGGLAALVLLLAGVSSTEMIADQGYAVDTRPQIPATNAQQETDASGRPDIFLVSIDTLRADAILDPKVPTPFLDELRARSLRSDYALAASPSTLPSHITMVLGESPLQHGAYTNLGHLDDNGATTLPEVLGQAGYRRVGTAANGLLDAYTGFDRGFEVLVNVAPRTVQEVSPKRVALSGRRMVWYSMPLPDLLSMKLSIGLTMRRLHGSGTLVAEDPILADPVRELSLAYLEDLYSEPTPFFFFLHFMDPHAPYKASPQFLGKLGGERAMPSRYSSYTPGTTMQCLEVLTALREGDSTAPEALQILRDRYHEEVMMVDDALAKIFARVEQSGRPTVILFTSDHGEHFAENDHMTHGNTLFAPNIQVPFFIAGPGITAGELRVRPTNQDIPLTLLNAAGFKTDRFGAGRNLLDPNVAETPYAASHDDLLAVYLDGYKLILDWQANDGPASSLTPVALYRMADGVAEPNNLLGSAELKEQQAALLAYAEQRRDEAVKRGLREFDDAERVNLAEMGYVFGADGNATEEGH